MRQRDTKVLRFASPIRGLAQRFAFAFLLLAAVGLIVLGKADAALVERLRVSISDGLVPIMSALSAPVDSVNSTLEEVRQLGSLREENERLRDEIGRLSRWEAAARELAAENRNFRELLNFAPEGVRESSTGRVIADTGGAFVRSVLINAGRRDGVAKGEAAINGEGLVGRVAEVGQGSARVLLITDLNSRIPVVLESTRHRAILAGDNSHRPRLLYLPGDAKITPGERVVTSGHGGVFPPGLPVGVVALIAGGEVRVQPFVDWDRLEFVRVVDFGVDDEHETAPSDAGEP